MTLLFLSGLVAPLIHAALDDGTPRRQLIRYTRNGGMRFLRVHRLQFSFCVCRKGIIL
jgi:hypothetical protein